MKSKEEIEKYLGMKIESNKEEQTRDSSYAMSADTSRYVSKYQDTYTVIVKVLPEESVNALKSLLKDSIKHGDLETAATCHSILLEESTFYKGHPNAIGLDINESMALNKYEAEQKAKAEEQARLKAEQEAKEKAEEQARLKAEQEAKEKAEEQTRIRAEQQEKDMLEQEYGLVGIEDRETLQRRLEDIVSKGIFLGADKASEKKVAEFKRMKQVIPRFEEFKSVYLQLRQAGLEDDLYANMDFQNVSFDDLLERATTILEEKAKAEEQRTEIEQPEVIIEEQPEVVTNPEQVVEETIEDEPSVAGETIEDTTATVTGTNIDSASMIEAHLEYMRNHQTQQTSQVVEDYWNEIHSQQAKVYEQPQPEKIRPLEESIRDTIGDKKDKQNQMQMKETKTLTVDIWMNRFDSWYSAIDRVSQNVKAKFVKMKSDIVNAISTKIKERMNKRKINTQEQDSGER